MIKKCFVGLVLAVALAFAVNAKADLVLASSYDGEGYLGEMFSVTISGKSSNLQLSPNSDYFTLSKASDVWGEEAPNWWSALGQGILHTLFPGYFDVDTWQNMSQHIYVLGGTFFDTEETIYYDVTGNAPNGID